MFTSVDYNALPSVDVADKQAEALVNSDLRTRLLDIIAKHKVQHLFGVRLVHRHFDMEDTEVACFQPLTISGIGEVVVMGPLPSSDIPKLSPQNYAVKDNQLLPFEYTTCKRPNIVDYPNFAADFAMEIAAANACNIFGLSAVTKGLPQLYEYEVPELRFTVMVPYQFLPSSQGEVNDIHTEWTSPTNIQPTTIPDPDGGPICYCRRTSSGHQYYTE